MSGGYFELLFQPASEGLEEVASKKWNALCKIVRQRKAGWGCLFYDPQVQTFGWSNYFIITSNRVIPKENFDVSEYEVQFTKANGNSKCFHLWSISESDPYHAASGLVVIFVDSESSELNHILCSRFRRRRCSILKNLKPEIGCKKGESQYCYVGGKCHRYDQGKPLCEEDGSPPIEFTECCYILLEGNDKEKKAVGILNIKGDKQQSSVPIWWKTSSVEQILGLPDKPTITNGEGKIEVEFSVTWSGPSPNGVNNNKEYQLELWKKTGAGCKEPPKNAKIHFNETCFNIAGLEFNSEYEVRLYAVNKYGESEPDVRTFRTKNAPKGSSGRHSSSSSVDYGQRHFPGASLFQDKPVQQRSFTLAQAPKGSSGSHPCHSFMEYGQSPFPIASLTQKPVQGRSYTQEYGESHFPGASLTQDKPVQQRSYSQALKGSFVGHSSHSSMDYGQCPLPLVTVTHKEQVQQRTCTQGTESRPVIATRDKRPPPTVFGHHHSKQLEGGLLHFDPYEEQAPPLAKSEEPQITSQCPESPNLLDYPQQLVKQIKQEYKGAVLCPFPWCEEELHFELSKIFTTLMILVREKERRKLTDDLVKMTDVFRPLRKCDCKTQCKCEREKPRVVLIEGPPGMGKTTYCQKLAYDWSVGGITEESFPKVNMLLRLTCRDMRDMKTFEIKKAIEDQLLPHDVDMTDKEHFFNFFDRCKDRILLVLDGLDELPEHLFDEFLRRMIKKKTFPSPYVLLTARHEAGMKVERHCDALFEIAGYSREDAHSYIKKYFSKHQDPSLAEKLIMEVNQDSKLGELTANALNTALLCLVFEDTGGILPYNRTMLFFELVDCVLKRYCSKYDIPLDNQDPVEKYTNQLNQLGELALEALLKDQLAFTVEEVKSKSTELVALGFLSREDSASKVRPKQTYAFIHKTFQEFFAAFHLAHEIKAADREKDALLAQLSPVDKYWQVWEFLITTAASKSDDTAVFLVSSICSAFQHQKPDQFSNRPKDSDNCKGEGKISKRGKRKDNYDSVCKDTSYEWEREQLELTNTDEYSFLKKVINTIAQCEKPNSGLQPYQVRMADTLASCVPINEVIVRNESYRTALDSRNPLALSEYLKSNHKLEKLAWLVKLDESATAALVDVLQTSHTLAHLHLTNGSCITSLTPALQANHTVTHLIFHRARISDEEAKALGTVLQSNHTLTHLCLADNAITSIGVEALAEALKFNRVLEDLNIGMNDIGDKGAGELSKALESNRTLRVLKVCGGETKLRIAYQGLRDIAHVLQCNSSLTYLDIHGHSFCDSSLTELGEALYLNHSLTHLYLGCADFPHPPGFSFGDSFVEAFSKALQSRRTKLTCLGLSCTSITSSQLKVLAKALGGNRTLKCLDLSQNQIDCPGAIALAEALKINKTLTYLELRDNTIGDSGAKEFVEVLLCNKTLMFLGLMFNQMTESGIDLFKVLGGRLELHRESSWVGVEWIRNF